MSTNTHNRTNFLCSIVLGLYNNEPLIVTYLAHMPNFGFEMQILIVLMCLFTVGHPMGPQSADQLEHGGPGHHNHLVAGLGLHPALPV
jgi:hypothetical protein